MSDARAPTTPDGQRPDDAQTVVLSIQHPAHVHFFKHAYRELDTRGHEVHVFVRDKSVVCDLLDAEDVPHTVLLDAGGGNVYANQLRYEWRLLRATRRLDPDVFASVGGVSTSHVASVLGARGVAFTDTEHATLSNTLAFPFADTVCTPACFRGDAGDDHQRYDGYHELAYLHPDRFEPDPTVLDEVGVDADEQFVVLRSVAWSAAHDAGNGGFVDVRDAVERLEATGATVLVTAEADLPDAVADRRVSVPPERMHDLLAFADCFVGEGATMAAESAVLGTPAVYVNTLETGLTDELAEQYGLLFRCHGPDRQVHALSRATAVLDGAVDRDWDAHRADLLSERTDTTDVVVDQILGGGG